jgi:hypothetical protein
MKWNNARVAALTTYLTVGGWLLSQAYYNPMVWGQGPQDKYPTVQLLCTMWLVGGFIALVVLIAWKWNASEPKN